MSNDFPIFKAATGDDPHEIPGVTNPWGHKGEEPAQAHMQWDSIWADRFGGVPSNRALEAGLTNAKLIRAHRAGMDALVARYTNSTLTERSLAAQLAAMEHAQRAAAMRRTALAQSRAVIIHDLTRIASSEQLRLDTQTGSTKAPTTDERSTESGGPSPQRIAIAAGVAAAVAAVGLFLLIVVLTGTSLRPNPYIAFTLAAGGGVLVATLRVALKNEGAPSGDS